MKRYILPVAVLFFLSACDKRLDIEPAQSISEDLALSTDENVKSVLLGAYDALSSGSLLAGNAMRDAELLGADGEIRWVGTYDGPRQVFNHEITAGNGEAEAMWTAAYNTINICNNVIDALGVVKAEDRDRVEGEARFIRASCYFTLVRYYGKTYEAGGANNQLGVPIVLRPTRGINESSFVPRNTVKECYDQVIDDLSKALGLLPAANDVFAKKTTAAAMLARVYLQMGNYTDARTYADQVIASNQFTLVSNYTTAFNNDNNSSEDIFALQVSNQDGANDMVLFYSIPAYGGRDGDIEIEQKHLDLYAATDKRRLFHYTGAGATRTGKWRDQYKNIPVIRLAEMYLIRAECDVRNGVSADADYNKTHVRAGLTAKTGVTLDDVLLERRLELAHEGHRIHDVKRLKGTVDGLNYDDPQLLYPIPAREIQANPKLAQNDGY